jgi:hypothetical protein
VTGTATLTVTVGTTQQFTSLTILPSAQNLTVLNQQAQFIALATSGSTGLQQDVTNSPLIKWTSSNPTAGFISTGGLAKDLSAGTSTITAILTNSDGSVVSGSATVTTSLTTVPQDLLSLAVIPANATVGNLQDTAQYLAIGTFSTSPYVRDLTNSVQWISTTPNIFPVTTNCGSGAPANCSPAPLAGSQNGGVVSAFGIGSGLIVAEYTDPIDKSLQTATANFTCPVPDLVPKPGQCYPGSQAAALLSTLTVYNEGLNNSNPGNTGTIPNWLVTAPSATGTQDVIHCGPGWTGFGGSVCTATYPVGATVIVTAPAGSGKFGGWSSNCTPTVPVTEAGPNSCQVTLTYDDTVGAIFN